MAITNHYLFDTLTLGNDSVGSINFIIYGGVISNDGKINQCLSWDFSAGSATFANGPLFAIPGIPNSVAFWVKLGSSIPTHNQTILDQSTASIGCRTSPSQDSVTINILYGSSLQILLPGNYLKNWTHIVLISDGYNEWSAYINGVFYGPYFLPSVSYGGSSTAIGSGGSGASVTNSIDDLRFYYNQSIRYSEVDFIYNSGLGTQTNNSGDGNASDSEYFPIIYVNPITGTASGSAGPGAALGSFPSVLMSAPSGNANINGIAFGSLSTVNVISFQGIAYPEFIAYGSLPTITVSAIQAVPVIGTTIQLDYVACDGEVTWTQNLPITGFSSAIQGQDAISSRITPTIGASGANIVFFEQRTLAASGNQTYDLKSLTDFLGGALSLDRAYAIILLPTSGSVSLSPGASNPFQWFFASSTANISLSSQNVFMFAQRESATITSGSKTLKVTNTSGAASATYKIAILGGR